MLTPGNFAFEKAERTSQQDVKILNIFANEDVYLTLRTIVRHGRP